MTPLLFAQDTTKTTDTTKVEPAKVTTEKVVPQAEHLTFSEATTFNVLLKETEQVKSDIKHFEDDVAKDHPGYFWDEKTNNLVKVPEKTKEPEKK